MNLSKFFLRRSTFLFITLLLFGREAGAVGERWNILFVFADDWGRYASCYKGLDGRPGLNDVVKTPNVDRVAREGTLFKNAFVNAPSCTPCRSSLLSGRYFFNCNRGAILNGAVWDPGIPSFPLMLLDSGYQIGKSYKVWSPGTPADAPIGEQKYAYEKAGRAPNNFSEEATAMMNRGASLADARETILSQVRGNFDAFLADGKPGKPWLYFFGPTTTHRTWTKGSGKKLWGIEPDSIKGKLPKFLPDVPEVREDVADYLGECQAVDAYVGVLLKRLGEIGELDRTIVVISGDHGMPGVPSGKCNLYDHGVSVALVVRVPGGKGGRIVDDIVRLPDLAPTFMEIGGVKPPDGLYGRSLLPLLQSEKSGQIDPSRTWAITGRERHVSVAREGNLPYPMRSLHTKDFVYIRNFAPDRWPMGMPGAVTETSEPSQDELEHNTHLAYADMDASPTKAWMMQHRHDSQWKWLYDFAFGKRPAEELYDLRKDPDMIINIAGEPDSRKTKEQLAAQLMEKLKDAKDPRVSDDPVFEKPPFTDPSESGGKRNKAAANKKAAKSRPSGSVASIDVCRLPGAPSILAARRRPGDVRCAAKMDGAPSGMRMRNGQETRPWLCIDSAHDPLTFFAHRLSRLVDKHGPCRPPPPQTGNAKSIFDGKTLDGWESPSPNLWAVKDGCLTGGDGNKIPYNDFLCTKASYSNFILHLKIKLMGDPKTGMINSGIQIRTKRNPKGHEVCGYQCDYGEPGWYAGIYDEGRRNKFIAPADMTVIHPVVKLRDWNDYVIKAEGNRIQTWLNGVQGVDYKEEDPNIPIDGIIGIQVHGGGNTSVQVKDVFIEELAPTKGAPTWESLGGVEGVRAKLKPNPQSAIPNPNSKRDISYNASDAQPKTPEEEQKTFTLPKGFEIELVAAESEGIGKFVTVDWDQQGRMWTQTALEYPVDGNENMERALALYASQGKDKVLVFDDTTGPGPHKFRVFTDGLAIPLGMMPYKNGVYVQHGPNIEFREDTDGNGKADKTTVILTGFGVQDSHLFMHEFRRMPGGWIWGAQGAFNSGKVKTSTGAETDFPSTRMARFRPDGSKFEILCNGPCNIWGFEVTGEGEMFIQEANDFGYPVMPFHIGANYPGCADRLWKSYAPEFPGPAQFRMGGTGLSGLALANKGSAFESSPHSPSAEPSNKPHLESADHRVIYVANPIIRKIQAIRIKPDGPRHALELLPDFLESSDPMFRPISIHFGPDGALYIVDWYNKIISHNEVPRNHPDRDKTRGRIWRVKSRSDGFQPSSTPLTAGSRHSLPMPDLTKCAPEQLLGLLGSDNIKQSHLAWQTISDRKLVALVPRLKDIVEDAKAKTAARVQALWALEGIMASDTIVPESLLADKDRNIRREAVATLGRTLIDRSRLKLIVTPETGAELREAAETSKRTDKIYSRIDAKILWKHVNPLSSDPDPEVRAEIIRQIGASIGPGTIGSVRAPGYLERSFFDPLNLLIRMAQPSLDAPVGPSTRNGKAIKIAEAYDREFERYLIRQTLEQHPDAVEAFLKTPEAGKLPLENRLLATLSLPAKTSAPLVAKLLGELKRPPNDEEILRLAEGLGDPAVNEALAAALKNPNSRQNIAAALLRLRTKLDANKLAPLLQTTARELLDGNEASQDLALQLAGEFQFAELEVPIVALLHNWLSNTAVPAVGVTGVSPVTSASGHGQDAPDTQRRDACVTALRALGLIGSKDIDLFTTLATTEKDPLIRNEALSALASSKSADAGSRVLALWKDLDGPGRRLALDRLTTTKPGAHAVVAALKNKTLKADDLDAAALDRLQAVLGPKDPELASVMNELSALFRPVLRLDGGKDNYVETGLTLDGSFTVETWVRLDPGIGNEDGILGAPGQLDMNFFDSQFRVWVGGTTHDAIVAKKKMAPDNWSHIAVTRDAKGLFRIYIDGELDQDISKPAPQKFENVRIGWAQPAKGTQGMLSEFRIWNRVRSPGEIRNNFDRGVEHAAKDDGLVYHGGGNQWGRLHGKARIAKTSDLPPLLTPDEATKLDEKFAGFRALAQKPGGDAAKGKLIAGLCMGCHLIQGQGGNLAPNISGAATMGVEGLLRNIITPNAAMEAGYRTYRAELKTGDIVDAFFVSEDKDAFVVRMPGLPDRRIPKAEVRSAKYIRRSLMPEGILDALQPEMVTDLFAYLMSLKG